MALTFDGSNDYCRATSPAGSSPTALAVGVWYKTTTVAQAQTIFTFCDAAGATSHRIEVYLSASGFLTAECNDGTVVTATHDVKSTAGVWQHAGLIYSSTTLEPYLNGVRARILPLPIANSPSGIKDLLLGISFDLSSRPFSGDLAEFGAWSTGIGAASMLVLADAFAPPIVRPNLLDMWAPLYGVDTPEPERVSGLNFAVNGPSKAAHTRMIYAA